MKKQRMYEITDLEEFIESLRNIILENFYDGGEELKKGISEFEELMKTKKERIDEKLTLQEAKSIIKPMLKTAINNTGGTEYTVTHRDFKRILEELNKRVISNILMELSSEGLIETGFDGSKNDFIFWIAENKNK